MNSAVWGPVEAARQARMCVLYDAMVSDWCDAPPRGRPALYQAERTSVWHDLNPPPPPSEFGPASYEQVVRLGARAPAGSLVLPFNPYLAMGHAALEGERVLQVLARADQAFADLGP